MRLSFTIDEMLQISDFLEGDIDIVDIGVFDSPQKWGQLMGSVTSFLILCIINGNICKRSYEIDKRRLFPLARIPMKVNGDDGLIKIGFFGYQYWKRYSRFCGLTPSVGKVYYHSNYFNINSTSFLVVDGNLQRVPYINLGLVYGIKRSGERVGPSDIKPEDMKYFEVEGIGGRMRTALADAMPEHETWVRKKFLNRHWSALTSSFLPWYIPTAFGGVGLPPRYKVSGDDVDELKITYIDGPTALDRQVCRAMLNNWFPDIGLPHSARDDTLLKIHQEAIKLLPKLKYSFVLTPLEGSVNEEYDRFMGVLYSYICYYRPSLVANKETDINQLGRMNRANERVWNYYLKHRSKYSHLTPFDLVHDRTRKFDSKFVVLGGVNSKDVIIEQES